MTGDCFEVCNGHADVPPAELVRVRYGSRRWQRERTKGIGASEIAATLGIHPYLSPLALYLRKTGQLTEEGRERAEAEWGRRLEGLILDRFEEWHRERERGVLDVKLLRGRMFRSAARTWQTCTPDAVAYFAPYDTPVRKLPDFEPAFIVQAKTRIGDRDEWGEDGTDDIPVHYRAQVLQEMDVLGVRLAYVPVLFSGHEFRVYRVRYDPKDVRVLRAAGEQFMRHLTTRTPPPVDAHAATGEALRRLHRTAEPGDVVVDAELAPKINRAKAVQARSKAMRDRLENRLRQELGDRCRAVDPSGAEVARRSVFDKADGSVGTRLTVHKQPKKGTRT